MKDTMFEANINDYDSDVVPDPDMFYRIINTPVPKMPTMPKLPKPSMPNFGLQWRRLKYTYRSRKWLFAAYSGGLLATLVGLGHYCYSNYYLKQE
jgi:hypothetical protein